MGRCWRPSGGVGPGGRVAVAPPESLWNRGRRGLLGVCGWGAGTIFFWGGGEANSHQVKFNNQLAIYLA